MHLSPTVAWVRARACLGLSLAAPRSMTLPGEHERVSLSRRRAAPLWAPRPGLPRPARGRPLTVPPSQPRALFCGPLRAPSPRPRSLPSAPHPCLPFAPGPSAPCALFLTRHIGPSAPDLRPARACPTLPSAPRPRLPLRPTRLRPLTPASLEPNGSLLPSPSPPLSPMVSSFPSLCAPPGPGPQLLRRTSPWAPPCPQSPHPRNLACRLPHLAFSPSASPPHAPHLSLGPSSSAPHAPHLLPIALTLDSLCRQAPSAPLKLASLCAPGTLGPLILGPSWDELP